MRWRHLNGNLIAEDEHGLNLTGGIILKFFEKFRFYTWETTETGRLDSKRVTTTAW